VADDLIARLKAGLDEDERVALAVVADQPSHTGHWRREGQEIWDEGDCQIVADYGAHEPGLNHIARHDPARVLWWVKAAREILEWYDEVTEGLDLTGYGEFGSLKDLPADRSLAVTLAVEAVRALASVYGDEAG